MTARPFIFDNTKMEIKPKHILASAGYPLYGFPWVEVEDGAYAWDGSLLSNTPIREVIYSSPRDDKNIFIVENYPQKIDRLITERLYDVFEKFEQQSGLGPHEIANIKSEYNTLVQNCGAKILSVTRIIRSEIESPTILKNANFSPKSVKELIAQGERKAIQKIDKVGYQKNR